MLKNYVVPLVLLTLGSVACGAQRKPDFKEAAWRGTQDAPMCSVKVNGHWEFYLCGSPTEAQRLSEERSAVWFDGAKLSHRIADKKFWLMTAVFAGSAAADEYLSVRAIQSGRGYEANPILGHSIPGGIAISSGVFAFGTWMAYERKRCTMLNKQFGIARERAWGQSLPWWSMGVVAAGVHAVGIASALR
ncbi:MAG: hypothetical protein WB997_03320 [Candidatus Acidiferrales bacterium]